MSITGLSKPLVDYICNIPLFESLNRDELDTVAEYMVHRNLKAGELLFNQWERADYVCFVEDGTLDVLKKEGPDEYASVITVSRGRSIGEMALIDSFPWTARVQAKTDVGLVILYKHKFEELMADHLQVGIKILKGLARLMAQNLRKTSSRLADYMLPLG